jgi:AAA family ATP:ADP antiporter
MIDPLGKLISLRRSEVGVASLLFFYLFLMIGAFMMGQAVGDALFLAVFPKQLPDAMIGSALAVGALVAVYIRLSSRLRLESIIIGTLLVFALLFAGFWLLALLQLPWVYLLVYIFVYAMGAMGPMMGWTLANYVLTTREARRIFGFIGAGAILGGTVTSFITADALRQGRLLPQSLLVAIALMLAACAILVKLLFWKAGQRLAALSQAPVARRQTPRSVGQSVKLIHNSPYLLRLTGLIVIGCLATCIVGYQFKLIAKAAYGTDTAGLAAFFGRFNGYMGLASMVFQLALTGPLLRAFGIRVTLFVVPVALMACSTGVLFAPTLLAGCLLRGSHYVLRYSLDKSSMELLYMPVSPEIRSQVKSFIDTFVYRSADGIAGLTLLLCANVLKFNPGQVSLVNLLVLAGWIAVANGVRREYLNVLRLAIERRKLDPEQTAAQVLDATTTEVLAQALQRGGEQRLLYGMSLFEMGRNAGWHPALRCLLEHRSPDVRHMALRLLSDAGDREILPRVEVLLGDESFEVRAEALHYLVVHTGRDPLMLLDEKSDLPAYVLQTALVAYLARIAEPDYSSAIELILQKMLAQAGPEGVLARREAARVLGVIPPSPLHNRLHELLRDNDHEVVEQALLSAGKIRRGEFLPVVIEKLGNPRLLAASRAALMLYGESAVATLESSLNDPAVPAAIRRRIPQTLSRIPATESAAALAHSLSQADPGLRYDVLKGLNKLRELDPALLPGDVDYEDMLNAELMGYYRSFQILAAYDSSTGNKEGDGPGLLLRRAFKERMDRELERIFQLLALLYHPRDMYNAFVGLTSGPPQLKANALEVLENLLQPDLYSRLANVLDPEVDPQQRLAFARRFCGVDVSSRIEALRILLHSEDTWLRTCALYVVGGLRLTELSQDMKKIGRSGDPLFQETWNWALARLAGRALAAEGS